MSEFTSASGTYSKTVGIAFNHHQYAFPDNAVFISFGNKPAEAYLNDWDVLSIEQAKELRAKLDEIIEEFEENSPKPKTPTEQALEFLNGLGIGSIVRFGPDEPGDSWASWIKRTQTEWEVIDSIRPSFVGEKRDVARFFRFTAPAKLPTLIFDSNAEDVF